MEAMSIRLDDLARLLDRSAYSLYHQLKQWFSSRILSGELAPGERLPDEFELCERLGVSRGVVRQAMRARICRDDLASTGPRYFRIHPKNG